MRYPGERFYDFHLAIRSTRAQMTDSAIDFVVVNEKHVSRALAWRAGMAMSPPEPRMDILSDMAFEEDFHEYMLAYTDVVRDVISVLPRDNANYLKFAFTLFDDEYIGRYARVAAQSSDRALLEALWLKCVDFVANPTKDDHSTLRSTALTMLICLCPRIETSWTQSVLELIDAFISTIKPPTTYMARDIVLVAGLLLGLIEHARHIDVRERCLRANMFVSLEMWLPAHVMRVHANLPDQMIRFCGAPWEPRLATLVTTQFYYNLRCLATALRPLELPVLQQLTIADAALPNTEPMHRKWRLLANIKHFRPSPQPVKMLCWH